MKNRAPAVDMVLLNATGSKADDKATNLLGADLGVQVDGAGAAVDLLHAGGAVALGIVGLAVELLATLTRAQDVVLVSEGVAELSAQLVWRRMSVVSFSQGRRREDLQ